MSTRVVLTTAITTPFAPSSFRPAPLKIRERELPIGGPPLGSICITAASAAPDSACELWHGADVRLLGEPLLRQRLQCPEVLGGAFGRQWELSDDHAVLDLLDVRVGDVQGRGQIHDHPVDRSS